MASITPDNSNPDRRSFLGVLSGLIGAGIAAVLGVGIGRFSLGPAFSEAQVAQWLDLGRLADIPENKLVKRNVIVSQLAGWGKFNQRKLLWLTRRGNDVKCFTAVCPHLGCTIVDAQDGFFCPCHSSVFDADGKVVSGPSPRGLDTLELKADGDQLQVKYQNFKQGIPEKEVLG